MITDISFLLIGLGIILLGCELFTNGIEWLGKKLNLGETAVGSLLAAVGTALPETMVPIVAILFSAKADQATNHQVGIGAILGAPFMLSTLAFFVTGFSVYCFSWQKRRSREMDVNLGCLRRDLTFFLLVYSGAILASVLKGAWIHGTIAFGLLMVYSLYVSRTLKESGEHSGELDALHFGKKHPDPSVRRVVFQVSIGLVCILLGAKLFVYHVTNISLLYHLSPLLLSLIITPIATELPEKMNSILWIKDGKDTLALGNITGAMVFQSCLPTAVGIAFTDWFLDRHAVASALLALFMAAFVLIYIHRYKRITPKVLIMGGLAYLAFLGYVLLT